MITGDFETRGVVDLRKVGATRYARDKRTQVLCLRWAYDDEDEIHLWHRDHPWTPKSARPAELLRRVASGEIFEAHNAGFEWAIWNYTLRREFPEFDVPLRLEQLRCSAAKGSCLSMPRGLGQAAKAAGLTEQKLADGQRLINKLAKPKWKTIRTVDENLIALGYSKKEATTVTREIVWCEEEAEHRANWEYCAQDVRTEREYSKWLPEMTETELQYWFMDQRMNQRGIALDHAAAETGLELAKEETKKLNDELHGLTLGAVDKGSRRKVLREWINEQLRDIAPDLYGLPDMKADTLSFALFGVPTKAGDEARAAAKPEQDKKWETLGSDALPAKRAMEICMEVNKTSVSKFQAMLNSVCDDGRLHDIMLYNGADRTGRWSGRGVQPHNFVRGWKAEMSDVWDAIHTLDRDYITLMYGEPIIVLSKAARGCLIASEGKELYAADFNAIEARKLAWLSNNRKMLDLFLNGGDPYIAMAMAIYKRELNKKDNPNERNMGKAAVLGLGYRMGWEKFQATVYANEGIWLDDEFCQMVVKVYRKEMCPEVEKLWFATEDAAIKAVRYGNRYTVGGDELGHGSYTYFVEGRFLYCEMPSGRRLAYLDPQVSEKVYWRFNATNERGRACTVMFPARKGVAFHKVRRHAEFMAEKQRKRLTSEAPESYVKPHLSFMGRDTYRKKWMRVGTHGGTLVENVDQASSRDLLAEAMKRIDEHDVFELLLSIHDEAIAEAPIGYSTVHEFETIMSKVPKWAPGMPITAEGWIGQRLRK